MPRRASLPGADLLFGGAPQPKSVRSEDPPPAAALEAALPPKAAPASAAPAGPSISRPRHAEKVTFYCTDSDLTRLEAARLDLRANHKLSCDRGRIVRAAIAEILDDFDTRGADSVLVRRLSSE
ncbi:MAG: hypothetical protein WD178_03725 [Actinomycetota bacterium]